MDGWMDGGGQPVHYKVARRGTKYKRYQRNVVPCHIRKRRADTFHHGAHLIFLSAPPTKVTVSVCVYIQIVKVQANKECCPHKGYVALIIILFLI
jgi:hypothetical protein